MFSNEARLLAAVAELAVSGLVPRLAESGFVLRIT
jgi:hypothetical protein